jgi:hypothetical protein
MYLSGCFTWFLILPVSNCYLEGEFDMSKVCGPGVDGIFRDCRYNLSY